MKKNLITIIALSLFAAVIITSPATLRAEPTNAPVSGAEKSKKYDTRPFHGKLTAVDKDVMTITVGARTFAVTSETKITKDNLPATLSDAVVGEMVGGAYKKSADGKLAATSIHLGLMPKNAGNSEQPKKQ